MKLGCKQNEANEVMHLTKFTMYIKKVYKVYLYYREMRYILVKYERTNDA